MSNELYDTFINKAKEKGYLSNRNVNPFMPGAKISKYYDDYKKLEQTYAKSTGASELEIADLRYSSKSNPLTSEGINPLKQYRTDEKALNFFNGNSAFYSGNAKKDRYMTYVDSDLERMKQMDDTQATNEYENKLSEVQKRTLQLLGVNNAIDFKGMLNTVKLNDDITNGSAAINMNPDNQVMVEYENDATEVTEGSDVDWGDVGKGAAAGAAAGAAIGSLFGGVGAVPGYAIGAIIGTGVGFLTELLDMNSENEVIEGINDAKRNFIAAMYGSTIGMVGDAAAGIGNVINTGIGFASGKDASEIEDYNPLNMIEGVTDGLDDYLINKQKNEYTGFSKFIVTDVMSVAGSLAGFAVMGAGMGKLLGAGEITFGNGVLNSFLGGSKAEIATRSVVALGAMDDTYDASIEAGASDEDALVGSLITGGANWAVLAQTKAIPGALTKKASQQAGGLATKEILKTVSMEMFTEAAEEIGEELSADLGKTYGTKSNQFKQVKDYAYIGFLGAIGGAFGAGIGTLNYKRAVDDGIEMIKVYNKDLVNEKITEFKQPTKDNPRGLSEIQAKDKALAFFQENGIEGIPVSVLKSLMLDKATEYKIAFEETQKLVSEKLKPQAEQILNSSTSLDNTEINQNKVVGVLLEAEMQQDAEVKRKLTTYPQAFVKMNTKENISQLANLTDADLKVINDSPVVVANEIVEEFINKGHSDMYAEMSNPKLTTENQVFDLVRKYNLTNDKLTTLKSRQLITDKTYTRLKEHVNGFEQRINKSVDNFLATNDIMNLTKGLEMFNDEQLSEFLDKKKLSVDDKYRVLKALGKTSIDPSTKNLGKTVNVLSSFAKKINNVRNKTTNSSTNKDAVSNVKTIKQNLDMLSDMKRELKAQYGSLKNVPWDTVNKLTDENITFEEFKNYEQDLKQQLRAEKKATTTRNKPVKNEVTKSLPPFQFVNEKKYYANKRNQAVAENDMIRQDYHHGLVKSLMLGTMPQTIAEKYNYEDQNHFMAQLTFRNPTLYKQLLGADTDQKINKQVINAADEILDKSIYAHIDDAATSILSKKTNTTGKGSSRVVIQLNDNQVVKVAMQEGAGMAQNEAEFDMYDEIDSFIEYEEVELEKDIREASIDEASSIYRTKQLQKMKKARKHLAVTYKNINNGQILISEKVTPLEDFQQDEIIQHLKDTGELENDIIIDEYGINDSDYYIDKWLTDTFDIAVDEFGFDLNDIWGHYSNLGVRDNGEIVILDYGFNDDIGNQFYGAYNRSFGAVIDYNEIISYDLYEHAQKTKEQAEQDIKIANEVIKRLNVLRDADEDFDNKLENAKEEMLNFESVDGDITYSNPGYFDGMATDGLDWYAHDYHFREIIKQKYLKKLANGSKIDIPIVTSFDFETENDSIHKENVTLDGFYASVAQRLLGKDEVHHGRVEGTAIDFLKNPLAVLTNRTNDLEWMDFTDKDSWYALENIIEEMQDNVNELYQLTMYNDRLISADIVYKMLDGEYVDFDLEDYNKVDGKEFVGSNNYDNGYLTHADFMEMDYNFQELYDVIEGGRQASTESDAEVINLADAKVEVQGTLKNFVNSDMDTVIKMQNAITNTEVIGVGIDYVNGQRIIKVYEYGEELGDHQFFYDKEALIIEWLRMNDTKTIEGEDGKTIQCE